MARFSPLNRKIHCTFKLMSDFDLIVLCEGVPYNSILTPVEQQPAELLCLSVFIPEAVSFPSRGPP